MLFRPPLPDTLPVHLRRSAEGELRAGAACVDVTPQHDLFLGGYGHRRRSRGVHDPLFARALVLERGDLQLALVTADVIGLQRHDLQPLTARWPELGLDPRHVLVHATHNHSGPDTLGIWGRPLLTSGQDEAYMEQLREGLFQAVARAQATLRPAELAGASRAIDPTGLMRNRRRPGLVDPVLALCHVREAGGGASIATAVELGMHPEVLTGDNHRLTADFPGVTCAALEEQLGGVALFLAGDLGGLVAPDRDPAVMARPGGGWQECRRIGQRVARESLALHEGLTDYSPAPTLVVATTPVFLKNENSLYDVLRWTGVLQRPMYRGGFLRTDVLLWQIGTLRVAGIPGELTPDLGLRLRRDLGGDPLLLVGLANDELGYLMPAQDHGRPLYAYERTLCPGPRAAARLCRRLEDLAVLLDAVAP